MFRITTTLLAANTRNVNQAARKAAAAMDQVRRKVQEAKMAKEMRNTFQDDVITDKHVLEAYKELEEEKRAEARGISVHALRHMEGRGGKGSNWDSAPRFQSSRGGGGGRKRGDEDDEFGGGFDGFREGGNGSKNNDNAW